MTCLSQKDQQMKFKHRRDFVKSLENSDEGVSTKQQFNK